MSKRAIISIYIFLLLFFIAVMIHYLCNLGVEKIEMYQKTPVIWYVPHPDDETLFMGGSMMKYYINGYCNIVILFTKGGNSSAIIEVNAKLKQKLTRSEFEEARVREFLAALTHLGVKKEDIILYDLPDGNLKLYEDYIYQIILNMERQYPNVIHQSMSYHDMHSDHKTIGRALLRAYNEKQISYANFYLNDFQFSSTGSYVYFTKEMKVAKINALKEYKYYNLNQYRYAIGNTSVRTTIDSQISNPREKIHRPGQ